MLLKGKNAVIYGRVERLVALWPTLSHEPPS